MDGGQIIGWVIGEHEHRFILQMQFNIALQMQCADKVLAVRHRHAPAAGGVRGVDGLLETRRLLLLDNADSLSVINKVVQRKALLPPHVGAVQRELEPAVKRPEHHAVAAVGVEYDMVVDPRPLQQPGRTFAGRS